MSQSEVARLMQEIERQCQAARRGLDGYAVVSKHEVIAHHFEAIGQCQDALGQLVGPEQANDLTARTYIRVMEENVPHGKA